MADHEEDAIEKWLGKKAPVTLDGLSKGMAPIVSAKPTAYALLLSSIDSWPIPLRLIKKLETAELEGNQETQIGCSVTASFYHSTSKRFFGSTWVGHEHTFSVKSSTKAISNLNEMVYFYSTLADPNCFIVIELVMTLFSPLDGSVSARYGCGWILINPFVPGDSGQNGMSTGKTNLFGGSPRDLLELKGNGASILKQLSTKTACSSLLSYTIWRPEGFGVILSSCIRENQIVGAHTAIAGLRRTSIHYFDRTEVVDTPCVGGAVRGTVLDWTLMPPQDADILASTSALKISRIIVKIPDRKNFEKALSAWAANTLPRHNPLLQKMRSSKLFGWNKTTDKEQEDPATATQVLERKLRICSHNGHAVLHNQWREADLQISNDDDQLHAEEGIELSSYTEGCRLLCVVEFTLERSRGGVVRSPKMTPQTTKFVVGLASCCSNESDAERTVSLNLISDRRAEALVDGIVFSPGFAEPLTLAFYMSNDNAKCQNEDQPNCVNFGPRTHSSDTINSKSIIIDSNQHARGDETKEDGSHAALFLDTSTITYDDSTANAVTSEETKSPTRVPIAPDAIGDISRSAYSASVEVGDGLSATRVSVSLQSFSAHLDGQVPDTFSFRFKLQGGPSFDEVCTRPFALSPSDSANGPRAIFDSESDFTFCYNYSTANSSKELALDLMDGELAVKCFESNCLVGILTLPTHLFLRQGKQTRALDNLSVDLVGLPTPQGERPKVLGSIILSIKSEGQKGEHAPRRKVAKPLIDSCPEIRSMVSELCKDDSGCATDLRQHQLQAVEHARPRRQEEGHFELEYRVLNAIQQAREGMKKDLIAKHVKNSKRMQIKVA